MDAQVTDFSMKEIDRLEIIQKIEDKRISQQAGARALGVSVRQCRRLQNRLRKYGPQGLRSRRRGQPSNRRLADEVKQAIVSLITEKYEDFGPTLAHEKLTDLHDVKCSVETVRTAMKAAGIWSSRSRKKKRVHQSRDRRECFGELVQIDGSPHDWFEGRGEPCTLIVFIDDATSKLLALKFFETETTAAYMDVTSMHLERYGRCSAYYSDRHSIFVTTKQASTGELSATPTQFKRALNTLDIGHILAYSPQAKGRVERANKTLQDRLVKELRLQGISDIASANAFLPSFIEQYNRKFAKPSKNPEDAHRLVLHDENELNWILSRQTSRKVSRNLQLSYLGVLLQIDPQKHRLKHATVVVCEDYSTGALTVLYEGNIVPFTVFNKSQTARTEAIDSKNANRVLNQIIKNQSSRKAYKPPADHPWRRFVV